MKPTEMEAFLSIVRSGNVTEAAKTLFISQSTLSQRLKNLENGLNVKLINRNKGMDSISLTLAGENFYKIAIKWEDLTSEAKNLKDNIFENTLSIGAVDSVHNYIMGPVYQEVFLHFAQIKLVIKTHQSDEIYSLLQQKQIDIGFTLQERVLKNFQVKKIFEEDMVLIMKKQNHSITEIYNLDLSPDHEIYINWGLKFRGWHEKWWGTEGTYGTQVDTGSLILRHMNHIKNWAIVPLSMAKEFNQKEQIDIISLYDPAPKRECFLVHSHSNYKKTILEECITKIENEMNKLGNY